MAPKPPLETDSLFHLPSPCSAIWSLSQEATDPNQLSLLIDDCDGGRRSMVGFLWLHVLGDSRVAHSWSRYRQFRPYSLPERPYSYWPRSIIVNRYILVILDTDQNPIGAHSVMERAREVEWTDKGYRQLWLPWPTWYNTTQSESTVNNMWKERSRPKKRCI